ncbi:hypothetical protein [Bacillus sp. SM2101]|nr:hypothetical protein [Bacillus sp. SM2101]
MFLQVGSGQYCGRDVTVVLWPCAYNGTTDSVYAWGAELIKE